MKKFFLFAATVMMSVSMFAANISCADAKAKIDASDTGEYTVEGYVTEIIDAAHPGFQNITFWMADAADGGQVLEVYRLSFKGKDADLIPIVGDKIAITTTLQKFKETYETNKISGYEIVAKGTGERYTAESLKPIVVNVADAVEAAKKLAEGASSDKCYEITGFVNSTLGEFKNNKQSFWITDVAGQKSDLQVFNGYFVSKEAPAKNDKVKVIGQLQYYMSKQGKQTLEVVNGQVEYIERAQGIEEVVLTEKAQKVMVDGVVYIVRDGKMYNALGTQVR
jgi:hypothetical protein